MIRLDRYSGAVWYYDAIIADLRLPLLAEATVGFESSNMSDVEDARASGASRLWTKDPRDVPWCQRRRGLYGRRSGSWSRC